MSPEEFIKQNLDLIQENRWEDFYYKALEGLGTENFVPVGRITNMLLSCEIDPLKGLNYIPQQFLANTTELDGNLNLVLSDKNILYISDSAFLNCKWIEKLIIPEGVEKLGASAVFMCDKLKEVRFPSTIKEIGNFNFYQCPVEKIFFHGTIEEWNSIKLPKTFFYKAKTSKIICMDGKTNLRH